MKLPFQFIVPVACAPAALCLWPQFAAAQPCTPEWSALAFKGFNGIPQSLAVFDDGSGRALYAGGYFDLAGGTPAYVAKWNGQEWLPLGKGVDGYVEAMLVFDDGAGSALYVAGQFNTAAGAPSHGVAKWDGQSWTALPYEGNTPSALASFDDGNGRGPALYVGDVDGVVTRWNGASWSPLPSLSSSVYTLAVFDDGQGGGPALHAGGRFASAFKWTGAEWQQLGKGTDDRVYVMMVFDDGRGGGPALYAGGAFNMAGGQPASRVAKWDGQEWSPMGDGVDGDVESMAVFDDGAGGGPALYVGGWFSNAGGQAAAYVAQWNGAAWSALDGGTNNLVASMVGFEDDAGGPSLYAAGDFANAGPLSVGRIARWGCQAGPACRADFNGDAVVNSQDFFDFLAAFFVELPTADFDGDGVINSQDFFDFLVAFFNGC